MNKKGFELAISTIVVIVLGLAVLVGLIYMVTGGFKKFKSSTDPFISSSEGTAVKEACRLACTAEDKFTYCCRNFTLGEQKILCTDDRFELGCNALCAAYSCPA